MTDKEIRVIERFHTLVIRKINVFEIRVFGSRARGTASDYSDLDILIVVDKLDYEIERYISDCAWRAGFDDDIIVMPIAITLEALTKSPLKESAFIKNIYRDGVIF